jgi:hypothetical protein
MKSSRRYIHLASSRKMAESASIGRLHVTGSNINSDNNVMCSKIPRNDVLTLYEGVTKSFRTESITKKQQ